LGFAVKLDKGDFIGRAALLKQNQEGKRQKLGCLTLSDRASVAIGNEPIRMQDQVIGWVTSGGYGYSVGQSIAYGYLPMTHTTPGTALTIEILGERVPAEVVREPLWDPKGERIKA
jgi:glycine cleavage system aminomethyltransferase T